MRWIPASLALIWMALIFALSARSTIPEPFGITTELTAIAGHLASYAVLAALLWWAIEPMHLTPQQRFWVALVGAVAYGLTDEWHQSFVPGRDASILDVGVDGVGAVGGLFAARRLVRLLWVPGDRR